MFSALVQTPHRRWNPLREEWVVVSPHRTQRPWQGQTESMADPAEVEYDPTCYLCPGNTRAGGHTTPEYLDAYVFENDFAALKSEIEGFVVDLNSRGLIRAQSERGICRVICFDPRHNLTMATMSREGIRKVVEVWAIQEAELGALSNIRYVQIFENRGAMMGSSNPHPHGQIWATEHIPDEPAREQEAQRKYFETFGTTLLMDYLEMELKEDTRIVAANEEWVALVPFWATWPFEIMLLPTRIAKNMNSLSSKARDGLADILQTVCSGYNLVFAAPFPYSMGFHPAPFDGSPSPSWQVHAHFYPPLLRSATIRKFMVGFELLGSPQRDITPEAAAEILRKAFSAQERVSQ